LCRLVAPPVVLATDGASELARLVAEARALAGVGDAVRTVCPRRVLWRRRRPIVPLLRSSGSVFSPGIDDGCDVDAANKRPDSGKSGSLWNVGNQGHCMGEVAQAIPSTACGACARSADATMTAFLLCDGLLYTECSCSLPPGYTLVDAGLFDAGPLDAVTFDDVMDDVRQQDATTDGQATRG
jgi:hypothetical protein